MTLKTTSRTLDAQKRALAVLQKHHISVGDSTTAAKDNDSAKDDLMDIRSTLASMESELAALREETTKEMRLANRRRSIEFAIRMCGWRYQDLNSFVPNKGIFDRHIFQAIFMRFLAGENYELSNEAKQRVGYGRDYYGLDYPDGKRLSYGRDYYSDDKLLENLSYLLGDLEPKLEKTETGRCWIYLP